MNRRQFISTTFYILFALFGLALSLLLVSEFFGLSSGAVRAICTSSHSGINSCRAVAESPYALIGRFPLVGQIPTATAGVIFYAFAALFGILNFFRKEQAQARLSLALFLSITGLVADAALYFISVFKIKAVCMLCSLSYLATLGMCVSAIMALKGNSFGNILLRAREYIMNPLRKEIVSLVLIALLSCGSGISSTIITGNQFEKYAKSKERAGELLAAYRFARIHTIDTAGAPLSGNPSAPVQMVMFIDYTCDHCMRAGKVISALLAEFPEKIAIRYKLYPLCGECPPRLGTTLEPCCIAALASACAHREGKFRAAYEALYDDLAAGIDHSTETINKIQKKIGAGDSFLRCINSLETAGEINRDVEEGERLKLTGTPALFVNGRRIPNEFIQQHLLKELILHLAQ